MNHDHDESGLLVEAVPLFFPSSVLVFVGAGKMVVVAFL